MSFEKPPAINPEQEVTSEAGKGKEGKPEVGDLVQWTSQGASQWEEPQQVKGFSEDGKYAFVEDSTTGIPVSQLSIESRLARVQKSKIDLDALGPIENPNDPNFGKTRGDLKKEYEERMEGPTREVVLFGGKRFRIPVIEGKENLDKIETTIREATNTLKREELKYKKDEMKDHEENATEERAKEEVVTTQKENRDINPKDNAENQQEEKQGMKEKRVDIFSKLASDPESVLKNFHDVVRTENTDGSRYTLMQGARIVLETLKAVYPDTKQFAERLRQMSERFDELKRIRARESNHLDNFAFKAFASKKVFSEMPEKEKKIFESKVGAIVKKPKIKKGEASAHFAIDPAFVMGDFFNVLDQVNK
ncbi:hypothetical protein KGQ33_05250 [Patescibacteria group bacterium]|nr:hypothetical protein [Patescibacteria group bacterium]